MLLPLTRAKERSIFDEEAQSLRKALLKYPIKFTRISSRYSGRRFPPCAEALESPPGGLIFAAPRGTEIRSVGDGIVVDAKYSKYNGNYVKIRHNSTHTTQYLHMSKFAKGIKSGVKVKTGTAHWLCGKHWFGYRAAFVLPFLEKWRAGRCVKS